MFEGVARWVRSRALVALISAASEARVKDVNRSEANATAQGTRADPRKWLFPERPGKAMPLKVELSGTWRKWLDEDVCWMITDEEKSVFLELSNDEERAQFVAVFWWRRIFGPSRLG
jgi:hypothetical protein